MAAIPGRCPHCGGGLYKDEDGDIRCRVCEKEPSWSPPAKTDEEKARDKRRKKAEKERYDFEKFEKEIREAELEAAIKAREEKKVEEAVIRPEDTPPSKFGTKKPHFDARREKILADYQIMTITEVERKWHMARGYFYFLRDRWKADGFTIPTAFADREAKPEAEGKSYAVCVCGYTVVGRAPAQCPICQEPRTKFTNMSQREFDMATKAALETTPVEPEAQPKKRGTRKSRDNFLEKHREEIIRDYYELTLIKFFAKWKLSSHRWAKLRDLWKVKLKRGVYPDSKTAPAVIETTEPVIESAPAVDEPFRTEPMNKRTGARAIWKF